MKYGNKTEDIGADMQIAMLLGYHLDNPCVDRKTGENIRAFYLKLAREQLPNFSEAHAKDYLIEKIEQYK